MAANDDKPRVAITPRQNPPSVRDEPATEVATVVECPTNQSNRPSPLAPRQTHTCPGDPELSYPTVGE